MNTSARKFELLEDRVVPAIVGDNEHVESWNLAPNYSPRSIQLVNVNGLLSARQTGDAASIAFNFFRDRAAQLGLSIADAQHVAVTDMYTDEDAVATTHIYLRQTFNGLTVANANANINVTREGQVINLGSTFFGGLSAWETYPAIVPAPGISAGDAIVATASQLGFQVKSNPAVATAAGGLEKRQTLLAPEASEIAIPVRLTYVAMPDGAHLSWNMSLQTPDGDHWYDAYADATTGELLYLADWTDHATYQVFPLPLENPNDGARQLVVDPANSTASPFGWHDTDGVAGAEFTDTRGNNVNAQDDGDANNTGGTRPSGGAALNFSFPLNLALAPNGYQSASITNLYYLNNVFHDIHFFYGFTPAAGNFQVNTYGGGGDGNDPVEADCQDGSGVNNASMSTPVDGLSPRMTSYIFTAPSPDRDSALDAGIIAHEYGHGVSRRLTGGPANSSALDTVQSRGMGEGWSDFFALMFTQKVTDTQNAAYPIGTYPVGQPPTGGGFRRQPYSYNMAINNQTIGLFNTSTEVHDTGELWCDALWDLNWLLINKFGFDANLYTGYAPGGGPASAGNKLLLRLVLDGMKLQPANPSILDARNAIFAADQALTGGANRNEIWQAFARRGMGVSFIDWSSTSTAVFEAFDLPQSISLPLASIGTPGTLAYSGSANGAIVAAGTVDSYTLSLDAGQKATLYLTPTDPMFLPNLEIRDPANTLIGSTTAASAGGVASLQGIALPTTGNYTINVSGASSTAGSYSLRLLLNAVVEAESIDGSTNNTVGAAQNLDSYFTALSGSAQLANVLATADRAGATPTETEGNDTAGTANSIANNFNAVANSVYHLGISGDLPTLSDNDFFNIGALQPGDIITIAQSGSSSLRGTHPDPQVYLTRAGAGGVVIYVDDNGPGKDSLIYRFTITISDTYYVRPFRYGVTEVGTYQLSMYLENASTPPNTGGTLTTETEPNDSPAGANDASSSWRPVQYLSRTAGVITTTADVDVYSTTFQAGDLVSGFVKTRSGLDARLSLLNAGGTPIAIDLGTSGTGGDSPIFAYFIPTTGTYYFEVGASVGTNGIGAYYLDVSLSSVATPPAGPVVPDLFAFNLTAGQGVSVGLKNLASGSFNLDLLDSGGNLLVSGLTGAANYHRNIANYVAPTTGAYLVRVTGSGPVDYSLSVARGITLEREANDSLATGNNINNSVGAAGYIANDDYFRVYLAAGQTIALQTSTPGDGAGQFVNNLNPAIDFYDPAGGLLASDDNSAPDGHNALLVRIAATTGSYGIRVRGVSATTGEYYLSANVTNDTTAPTIANIYFGGSAWTSAFRAAAGSPNYGYPAQTGVGQLASLPWSTIDTVYFQFNENVDVQQADLAVRGLNLANYTIANFTYDNVNFVGRWTMSAAIDTDRLIFDLDGDSASAVVDLAGNKLAGSWTESTSTFPTTGAAGNDFKYRTVIAVGDADRNGQVRNTDTNLVRANLFIDAGQAGYNIYSDIDGNGQTRNADLNAVRSHLFIDPPAGPGPNRPVRNRNLGDRRTYESRVPSNEVIDFKSSVVSDFTQTARSHSIHRAASSPILESFDAFFSEF